MAGKIGNRPQQYTTANALQCCACTAPVTRRSGRSEFVVARRLAHNRYLGAAVHQWRSATRASVSGHASSPTPRSPKATVYRRLRRSPHRKWRGRVCGLRSLRERRRAVEGFDVIRAILPLPSCDTRDQGIRMKDRRPYCPMWNPRGMNKSSTALTIFIGESHNEHAFPAPGTATSLASAARLVRFNDSIRIEARLDVT
ncbi:hypothetical protein ACIA5H_35120 [Nocardia sp. NPDC051900]|uniref:hypothetical protein n=1 Tax=Nocardia sp. NPDC051900 TaxID=3364326 RepID=UPI0037B5496A